MQKLDAKDEELMEEKKKRRNAVAREADRRKAVEQTVDDLYDWVDKLRAEIQSARQDARAANKETKAAIRDKAKVETVASKRLSLLKDLKLCLDQAKAWLMSPSSERRWNGCARYRCRLRKSGPWVGGGWFKVARSHCFVDM